MVRKSMAAAAATIALCCSTDRADAVDFSDMFHLHGYGTLGVTHSDQDQADYVVSWITQPKGAGYTHEWSADVDSKLALQLDANFTDHLSAVVQLISENLNNASWTGKINPSYRPSLEWANIKYRINNDLSVRVGRIVLPFNMLSEYRNVGYALPFVRAPIEVYGAIPFTNSDGMDVTWAHAISGVTNTLVVHGGSQSLRATVGATQTNMFGINDTVEWGSLLVRAAYLYSPVKAPTGIPIFNAFAQAVAHLPNGAGAANAAQALWLDHVYNLTHWTYISHYELGATYDPGSWFAMAEWSSHQTDNLYGRIITGFAAAGYRYQKLTPYLAFSRVKSQHDVQSLIDLGSLPPGLVGLGATVNGIATGIAASNHSQQSTSAGVRWDPTHNVDVKLQYDYVDTDRGSTGYFTRIQPGFLPGSHANVVSATVDFVF